MLCSCLFLLNSLIFHCRCGPTVYAPSHMGHARTYLGFDIIRRILTDYFRYNVTLVMNITDIDDKIILQSNEQNIPHLELSRKFELEFHDDMRRLGALPPTVLTRVTEYVPEIVAYIQDICDKGLAYESNKSVYFNVNAFEALPDFHYCKLSPEQIQNAALLAEGEGKLMMTQEFAAEKRSPRDFALWKCSKPGEPSWESPWGPGRPGWHIECSVMASDVFLKIFDSPIMDIHSGGVDLKFPHHDNEMAQAEAHAGCTQWVNYFVHAGHLDIKGFKMSKSLKNFITIRQALEQHSPRQVRLCFLLHKYNAGMDYGDNTMSHALVMERQFAEFFHNTKAVLREHSIADAQKWNDDTQKMQMALQQAEEKVDAALRDDFDTPTAMAALVELIKATNVYLETPDTIVYLVLKNVAIYVTRILQVFGVIQNDDIGFPMAGASSDQNTTEETLAPILNALMEFRSSVRDEARSGNVQGVLKECDVFRDDVLPPLNIRLEDKPGKSVWKLEDPEARAQRQLEVMRKQEEKERLAADMAKRDALKSLTPQDFVRQLTLDDGTTLKYSQFNKEGIPTHGSDGEPLNKNQSKKAIKEFQTQEKKYEKYMKQQQQQQQGEVE